MSFVTRTGPDLGGFSTVANDVPHRFDREDARHLQPMDIDPLDVCVQGLTLVRPGSPFRLGPLDLRWPLRARVALVGPSGSGKTTLLRLLAGIERATAGSIACGPTIWSEGPHTRVPPAARRIGFVFQDGALWPHMTAADHIRFVDPHATAAAADALLARVGLSGFSKRRPTELSGGERQRLALARAVAGAPQVLLLDEPLHSVDVHLRDELSLLIRSLAEERGLGLVVVTHDRRDAFALASEILVLHAGRLIEAGPAHRLARDPQTAFTATFLGAATCIPLPPPSGGRLTTPFGDHPAPAANAGTGGLVLAVGPGEIKIVATGAARANGRVLRVVPHASGLVASVQLGAHVVQVHCEASVIEGSNVGLELTRPPRFLPATPAGGSP